MARKPANMNDAPSTGVSAPAAGMVVLGDLKVHRLGFGAMRLCAGYAWGEPRDRPAAHRVLRRALELGVNFIDTADSYGPEVSENLIAEALHPYPEGLVIATKGGYVRGPHGGWNADGRPEHLRAALEGSLARRNLDRIDLYQLHFPNPRVPAGTTMRGMRALLDDGVIRRVGVSNYSLGGWQAAELALGRPVVSDQVRFSLASPAPRRDLVPYAAEHDRVVIAYSPLAQGLLAHDVDAGPGSVMASALASRRARVPARMRSPLARERNRRLARPLLDALEEVARANGATRAQVSLAWVIGHGNVIAIPGARTIAQLEENAAAADLELSAAERDRLTLEADRLEAALRR